MSKAASMLHLSVYPYIHPFVNVSIQPFIHPSICPVGLEAWHDGIFPLLFLPPRTPLSTPHPRFCSITDTMKSRAAGERSRAPSAARHTRGRGARAHTCLAHMLSLECLRLSVMVTMVEMLMRVIILMFSRSLRHLDIRNLPWSRLVFFPLFISSFHLY